MTWVPWSGHGMTEFFCKNSVYFYFAKLLFIKVIEFLFRLFYNPCEPTGMLGQGRKKSLIVAVFFGTLISDYGKIKNHHWEMMVGVLEKSMFADPVAFNI